MDNFYARYPVTGGGGGSGTVTSVGLSMPSIFTVTGSPVTTSGTLTATLNTESANAVFAGPTTGAAATPTFRGIALADLPTIAATNITYTPTISGNWSTVPTNVGLALDDLSSSGIFKSQAQNLFLASPDGSSGLPSFRAITSGDIPVPTGTPDTVAGFDGAGNLETIPGWGIAASTTGGMSQNLTYAPVDPGSPQTHIFNHFTNTLAPAADLTQLNIQGWRNDFTLSGPFAIDDFRAIFNILQYQGAGVMGNMIAQDVSITMGDGGVSTSSDDTGFNQFISLATNHSANSVTSLNVDTDIASGASIAGNLDILNSSVNIQAGSSIQGINGLTTSVTLDGAIGDNIQMESHQIDVNVNQPGIGLAYSNLGGNVAGQMQFINGPNFGPQLRSGANIASSVQGFLDATRVYSGATTNGFTSFGAYVNLDSGATVNNGYTAFSANPVIAANLSGNGLNGYSLGTQTSNAMSYFNGFSAFPNLNSGTNISGALQTFTDGSVIHNGAAVNSYSNFSAFPTYTAGAAINSAYGFTYNPSGGADIPGNITGLNVGMNGLSGSLSNITGINVSVGTLVDQANPQGPVGIQSDGRMSVNATTPMNSSLGFQIGNRIENLMHIPSGSPVAGTDVLGNNFAGDLEAEDNMAVGPIGLGWNSVGFIASLGIAATKTVDSVTVFLPASSLPDPGYATGGNITEMHMIRTFPPLNQGGTANITNLYGFKIDSLFGAFSSGAANAWGLYLEDSNLNNWIEGKLVIGGATALPVGSEVLSVTGSSLLSGDLDMDTHQIHNVVDPTLAQDAATKNYVDTVASQLQPIQAVSAASVATIAGTYLNGAAGIGATFTTTSVAALVIDGYTPTLNQRVLLKDQTSGFQNGVYNVTQLATGVLPTILTRSLDYDTATDIDAGNLVPVINGTVNAQTSWLQTAQVNTVGTDALVFVEWTANPANYLLKSNNLSDVASTSLAFKNISPLTTLGDLIYEAAGPAPARLPIGSTGDVLTVAGGVPTWAAATSSSLYDLVVGPAQIYTTIGAAITAASAGQSIFIQTGTYVENPVVNKQLIITGAGRGVVISGSLTFDTGSDESLMTQFKVTGGFTINSGVNGVMATNWWNGSASTYTDNGTGTYVQLIQE